jgi:glycosyltransferase involved in cell wall biosynthesis
MDLFPATVDTLGLLDIRIAFIGLIQVSHPTPIQSPLMRVAIVHYHLRRGGVTRIIQQAVSALSAHDIEAIVLTGEPPAEPTEGLPHVKVVAGLGYEGVSVHLTGHELAANLEQAARQAFGAPPDLWHFHNHSLGKNRALPEAVRRLADARHRLLLQIHDFPEDGRPANYRRLMEHPGQGDAGRLSTYLYPQAGHIHYAVLNGRDRSFMAASGVLDECLHLLPNAVWLPSSESVPVPELELKEERLWLYPTRAIRRKNLGEFLLWAALASEAERFATTLAPENPLERPIYERWVNFARALRLPVEFEVGARPQVNFGRLVRSAYTLITTSVAEGFGLAFLEPWLMGRPITGRDLPEITGEFRVAGIDLRPLYERLEVPVEWIGMRLLREKASQGLQRYLTAYGRNPGPNDLEQTLSAWVHDGRVDFGRLDEALQSQVIKRVIDSTEARSQLSPVGLPRASNPLEQLECNRNATMRSFSLETYGKQLLQVYRKLLASDPEPPTAFSGEVLLEQFLSPDRLFLLRT